MTDEEEYEAHLASEMFQELIVSIGTTLLTPLNDEQREYVLTKAHDEFRFWRVEDKLKGLI